MTRFAYSVLALMLLAAPLRAQTASEVISAQIDAFRAADFDEAFGYASDNLRAYFGSAENFGRMVRSGYPMVLDPAEMRFLGRGERAGREVQRVLILDREGRSFLLEYEMTGEGTGLRIAGVRILPETGAGV